MSKKTIYMCQQCGEDFSKWAGQCSNCNSWNSLVESKFKPAKQNVVSSNTKLVKLTELNESSNPIKLTTGLGEFNRVLGGGIVPGAVILIGGDPGIGKSTLLTQVLGNIGLEEKILYITAEESIEQVSARVKRFNLSANENKLLCSTTSLEEIISHIEKNRPKVVIVDSIQTIFSESLNSAAGSVSQVRECTAQLIQIAKSLDISFFIVGHVTKDGAIAGPRILEHMVDTVLYFEGSDNDKYRMLRSVKNRFGPTHELGVFAMTDRGLVEVKNPSAIFLSQFIQGREGTFISSIWEGSRTILIEIQALLDASMLGTPRRVSVGVDQNRVSMLLAILNKYADVSTGEYDVYINVVGGIKVSETSIDLAVLLCIYSSIKMMNFSEKVIVFGEVGLSGEIRPVQHGQERLIEAAKLGFELAIVPIKNKPKNPIVGIEVIGIETLEDAITILNKHTKRKVS